MKRIFTKTILVVSVITLIIVCFCFGASAVTDGYYTYTVSNGEVTITNVDRSISGDVIIPSAFDGNPVTKINIFAFSFCDSLTSVTIPDSIKNIDKFSFSSCDSLAYINVDENNTCYSNDEYGVLFNKDKSTLVQYPMGNERTSYTIADSVTSIGEGAFDGCNNIISIDIPDSVTLIGESAFGGCESLTSIIIPDSVTRIYNDTFRNCDSLTSISFPDGVTIIGHESFYGCDSLTRVVIPKSVTSIGAMTFDECENLKTVVYAGSESDWDNISFGWGNFDGATIHYNGCLGYYDSEIIKNATCTETGIVNYSCLCGNQYSETTAKKEHEYTTAITKASLSVNGEIVNTCTVCGYVSLTTIEKISSVTLSATKFTYNGKVQIPSVTVKDNSGNALRKNIDYTVTYESGRKAPGKYTVTITFKGNYSGTKKLYFTIAPKATSKITASQTKSTITLKWSRVTGADGYRVYKYNSKTKKYEYYKSTTSASLKVTKLSVGTVYKFKVRAYVKDNGTIWGSYSSAFETATKTKTPTLKVISSTKGKATLSWTNVSGESGYQVYYSTKKSGDFKKIASYKTNKVKGSKSKLRSGKTYYFKVRAYKKTDSGTVYSSWSSVKSIKVK